MTPAPLKTTLLRCGLLLLIGCIWLSGCSTPSTRAPLPTDNPLLYQAQTAQANQQPLQAAQLYEQLAMQSVSPEREQYLQAAIQAYLDGDETDAAARLAQGLSQTALSPQQQRDIRFLLARIQLQQGKSDAALSTLDSIKPIDLEAEQQIVFYQLRSDAYFQAGNLLESAQARASLDALLNDDAQRLANQKSILETLVLLSDQALDLLKPPPPNPMIGWMDLARLVKSRAITSIDDPVIANWREINPAHMANQALLADLAEHPIQASTIIPSIGVLLPESGPYAGAAQAIRQGILSAALAQTGTESPRLKFYDTESASISTLYAQAISDGAEAIIGPLDKNQVTELANMVSLEKPVLALNHITDVSPENLYQFGLLPEEEAEQVASLAWLNGHINALILTQQSEFGQRVARHFARIWTALGGQIKDVQAYRSADADHSVVIRNLLKLNDSEARYRSLVNRLNLPLSFEERRRHDADFLFLVTTPDAGRLIKPQLRFHRASDLPVYATSSVFSGQIDASMDLDLNEITFCDMPWLIDDQDIGQTNAPALASLWPDLSRSYKRLFSLGLDAYQILPQLAQLQNNPMGRMRGNSGILSVNAQRLVKRQLTCAEFQRGTPRLIGLAPNLKIPEINAPAMSGSGSLTPQDAVTTPLPAPGAQAQPIAN